MLGFSLPPEVETSFGALIAAMRTPRPDPTTLPDDGYDPAFVADTAPILDFLYRQWFRATVVGFENIPSSGPALIVANHSGGLPYDGAVLIHAIRVDHAAHRHLRALVADFVFAAGWMRNVVSRIGCVRAASANGLRLLEKGELVGVFPEGLKGIGKPFRERYHLDHFGRGGFVRLARRAGVPIVPAAIVGAEEIHPVLGKLTSLPRKLGIPYIPITPTFPWLGPLGLLPLPTKWTIRFGSPMEMPREDAEGAPSTVELAEQVRGRIDAMIAESLAARRSVLFG